MNSPTQEISVDDAGPLVNRRDLLRASTGLAQAFGVEMSVHQQPQIAGHLMAATPGGIKHGIEVYMPDMDPFFYQMIENKNPTENGIYRLPEGPGFGFVYDKKVVAKYRHDV